MLYEIVTLSKQVFCRKYCFSNGIYGKEDTMVTIQLDCAIADKFDMYYVDQNGDKVRPYIIHRTSLGCYERTLAWLIEKYGVVMNGKKVLRIMKKYNLMAEYIRKAKKKNKNERIEDNVKPNLLKRNFTTDRLNKVWDTDVTYLIFKGSRAYLSTIIDLYDRHVISYVISKRNDLKLVMDTLNQALAKEKDVHGIIIHSDQGFQYTSYEYKAICESNGIQISMSRKGTPIDDSPIESWHALLKKETLYNNNITSLQEYIQLVEEWILFYSTTRLKSKVKKKRKTYTKREK